MSWVLMILAMAGLLIVAVVAFRAFEMDVDGKREADRPALHWSAAQVEVELSKFISTLARFSMNDPDISQADVNVLAQVVATTRVACSSTRDWELLWTVN